MHAINHTTHEIRRVTQDGETRIRERMKSTKKPRGKVLYRNAMKGDTWSFFDTVEDAMDFKVLIALEGVYDASG